MTLATPTDSVLSEIEAAANGQGISSALALGVANVESGISQTNTKGGITTSVTGALGVFQLEPATAAGLGVDPTNERANILGGTTYLRQMLDMFGGDQTKALEAYNWGPGALQNAIAKGLAIPSDVQAYASDVITGENNYAVQYGLATQPQFSGAQAATAAQRIVNVAQATSDNVGNSGITSGDVSGATDAAKKAAAAVAKGAIAIAFPADLTKNILTVGVILALILGGIFIVAPRGATTVVGAAALA